MSTTKANFVAYTGTAKVLEGVSVQAGPFVLPVNSPVGQEIAQGSGGSVIDLVSVDLSSAGYAKNAGVVLSLTGSTPITIDLTALAAATGVVLAGDTTFAKFNQIVLNNLGTVDVSVAPGASNGASLPITGTTPAITVPAASVVTLQSVAGITVDGTHKTITVTPTSGGTLGIAVGGA